MQVEIAAVFFRSVSIWIVLAVIKNPNTKKHKSKSQQLICAFRKITIIPEITKVAECKSADTGDGPSIASSNHKNDKNEIDLIPHVRIKIVIAQLFRISELLTPIQNITIIKKKSPILLIEIAIEAPRAAEIRNA